MSQYKDKGEVLKGLKTSLNDFASDLSDLNTIKSKYYDDPYGFIQNELNITFSYKIERLFKWIAERVKANKPVRVIIKGPRGSGKTYQMSAVEFVLWYLYDADCVNLGGSEQQASLAYKYIVNYIYKVPEVKSNVTKVLQSDTVKNGPPPQPYIKCLAASEKSVRGPHPGGERKSPGVIVGDEAAEMEDGLITSAIPQLNTAHPPVLLLFSTFHVAGGDFQTFWETSTDIQEWDDSDPRKASRMYRVSIDAFDINEQCTFNCKQCIKDIQETYCKFVCACKDKFDYFVEHEPKAIDIHGDGGGKICPDCNKPYLRKAKLPKHGWMKMDEIFWAKETYNKDKFEVEYMGYKPSITGYVLDINKIVTLCQDKEFHYKPSIKVMIGIDWGFSGETAIIPVALMDGVYYVMQPAYFTNTSDTEIMNFCRNLAQSISKYDPHPIFNCDSSHPFQNNRMRDEFNLSVREVNFSKEKEIGAGVLRYLVERDMIRFSTRTENDRKLVDTLKRWRRDKNGTIQKMKGDHPADALLCATIDQSMDSEIASITHAPGNPLSRTDNFWDQYGPWS